MIKLAEKMGKKAKMLCLQVLDWLTPYFTLQYQPWVTHLGHTNKGKITK